MTSKKRLTKNDTSDDIKSDDDLMFRTCRDVTIHIENSCNKGNRKISVEPQDFSETKAHRNLVKPIDLFRSGHRLVLDDYTSDSDIESNRSTSIRNRSRSRSVSVGRNFKQKCSNKIRSSSRRCHSTSRKSRGRTRGHKDYHRKRILHNKIKEIIPRNTIMIISPLYIISQQKVTGVPEAKALQFVTIILLTNKNIFIEKQENLFCEMREAKLVGGSRSSINANEDDSQEDFSCKVYYSQNGILIETLQEVKKVDSNRKWITSEEKDHMELCKTRLMNEAKSSHIDGYLTINMKEKIEAKEQIYKRSEEMTISLYGSETDIHNEIDADRTTFDPTRTIKFNEKLFFDVKNIGITIKHEAIANMSNHWNRKDGTFGEQHCDYREIYFDIDSAVRKSKETLVPSNSFPSMEMTMTPEKTIYNTIQNYSDTPQASSTPKSEASFISLRGIQGKPILTPINSVKSPFNLNRKRSTPNITMHSPKLKKTSEIDLDSSFRRRSVTKKLLDVIKERTDSSSESTESPNSSPLSKFFTRKSKSSSPRTSPIPKTPRSGELRVKETKIIREIRERQGRSPEINEKKEESIKVEKVPIDRDQSVIRGGNDSSDIGNITRKTFNTTIPNETRTDASTETNESKKIVIPSQSPIKVKATPSKRKDSKQEKFRKVLKMEAEVDRKPYELNLQLDFEGSKDPEVKVKRVTFHGKVLWEYTTQGRTKMENSQIVETSTSK